MLRSAADHYQRSGLLVERAVREARKARAKGSVPLAVAVTTSQITAAKMGQTAVARQLVEQSVEAPAGALLNLTQFATAASALTQMLASAGDVGFNRLIASLVQDAGRAAESVSVATRPGVGWVRTLTPPSCSRCVVLAGRVYPYSSGFQRHPNDDCVTTAVREGDATEAVEPLDLLRRGQIRGLSQADTKALLDGADFNQVVNVRRKSSGLIEAGQTLTRAGRPTPAGVYRLASDRDEAIALLERYGYVTT